MTPYLALCDGEWAIDSKTKLRGFASALLNAQFVADLENKSGRQNSEGLSPLELAVSYANGTLKNGVAILPINSVIVHRSTRFTELYSYYYGITIIENLDKAFSMAMADPSVKAVLFKVDSGGGQAMGNAGLSDKIFNARGQKPIVAHVEGYGCSAAYYLASAADQIFATRDSSVGSIGSVLSFYNLDKYLEKLGIEEIEIVSSVSPDKRPDETTDEGRAKYQAWVDESGQRFVADVARNRGVSEQTVLDKYGKGWICDGENALKNGMIDGLGTFEAVLNGLVNGADAAQVKTQLEQTQNTAMDKLKSLWAKINGRESHDVAATAQTTQTTGQLCEEANVENTTPMENETTTPPTGTLATGSAPSADQTAQIGALQTRLATLFGQSVANKAMPANREQWVKAVQDLHVKAQENGTETQLETALALLPDAVQVANGVAPMEQSVLEAQGAQKAQDPDASDAPMTPERRVELLESSTLGQSVLS